MARHDFHSFRASPRDMKAHQKLLRSNEFIRYVSLADARRYLEDQLQSELHDARVAGERGYFADGAGRGEMITSGYVW